MTKLILTFLSLFSLQVIGQVNLVLNPSFESTVSCPVFGAGWSSCSNWNNVNMNLGAGMWGTPDYYHPCGQNGAAPPATFSGTCSAQSGGAFMGLVVYNVSYPNYREYLSSQLACTMTPGTTYTLSFWLTNGTGIKSPWTIRNLGVHFSNGPLSQSGWGLINVVPQCEITTNIASNIWTQYTFTINPVSNWNYITIGAFRSDALNNPVMSFPNPGGNFSAYANYYLDNITLMAPAQSGNSITISQNPNQSMICAGSAQTLTASGGNNYIWNNGVTGNTIVVSPSVTTTYTVYDACSAGSIQTQAQITVSVANLPTISVSGPTALCTGESATISGVNTSSINIWNVPMINGVGVVTPTASTVYTITGWQNGNPCSNTITHSINVYPNPTLSISGSSSICLGTGITILASGANTYTWSTGGIGSTINFTPSVTTVLSVTGSINPNNCRSALTHTVNVVNPPNVSIGSATICSGQSTTLSAPSADYISIPGTPSSGNTVAVSPTANTIYTITAWQNGSPCPATLTVSVAVNPTPTLTISGNTLVCLGSSSTFSATGANSYTWSTGANSSSLAITPSASTVLTVTGFYGISKCNSQKSVTISVIDCHKTAIADYAIGQFQVFPNPFLSDITVEFDSNIALDQIKITDLYGKDHAVFSFHNSKKEIQNIQINTESIKPGVYFLTIKTTDGQVFGRKIVKH